MILNGHEYKLCMPIKVVLDEHAYMPTRAHETDAGFDLYSTRRVEVRAGESAVIDTGVHIAIPEGYQGEVKSRSGMNFNRSLVVPTGTIDAGYTGSISVKIYNFSCDDAVIRDGDKIAQLVISPIESPIFELTDSLEDTDRGDNGFGSSGR